MAVVDCWFPLTQMTLNENLDTLKNVVVGPKKGNAVHPKLSYFTLNNLI